MVLKPLFLRLAKGLGLFALSRMLTRGQLRILCYHGIWLGGEPHYGDCLFMSADRFRKRMALLARCGYRVIPLRQACDDLANRRVRTRDVVITIDDGWVGTYLHMLPVLEQHGYPASLYLTTKDVVDQEPVVYVLATFLAGRAIHPPDLRRLFPDQTLPHPSTQQLSRAIAARILSQPTAAARRAETLRIADLLGIDLDNLEARRVFMLMKPGEVRDAHERGLDIQLHTHSHRMHGFNPDRLRQELERNRDVLGQMLGKAPAQLNHFCYPSGLYRPELFPVLASSGIQSATTTEFGLNPPGTSPYALKRILDGESLSDIEFEARLSGFWSLMSALRSRLGQIVRTVRALKRDTIA